MSNLSYSPRQKITLEEVEKLVSEFNDAKKLRVEILSNHVLNKMKLRGAKNFGPAQAREIVLRMIVKTEGAILL